MHRSTRRRCGVVWCLKAIIVSSPFLSVSLLCPHQHLCVPVYLSTAPHPSKCPQCVLALTLLMPAFTSLHFSTRLQLKECLLEVRTDMMQHGALALTPLIPLGSGHKARSSRRTTHHTHAHGDCCPPYYTHTLDRRPPPRLPRSLVDRIQRHPIVHAADGRPTTRDKAQEPMYVMSLPARSCARSCARSPGVPDPPARACRLMASSCVRNVQT